MCVLINAMYVLRCMYMDRWICGKLTLDIVVFVLYICSVVMWIDDTMTNRFTQQIVLELGRKA